MTEAEKKYWDKIRERDIRLRKFLASRGLPDSDPRELCQYLSAIRCIQGNLNNSVSFAATLLAKEYLAQYFNIGEFGAAAKPQGASGPDIHIRMTNGEEILAEIKTNLPYKIRDFGANQKKEFQKDFDKLNASAATFRFLFVTEEQTFNLLKEKYARKIPSVRIVDLISGAEYAAQHAVAAHR